MGGQGRGQKTGKPKTAAVNHVRPYMRISLLSFLVLLFSNAIVSPACR